ncbi:Fatty acid metabolism regulator protein [Actinokineospora sp. UTMC 2448]|nr:Fatty acid metabolism regulator protein [Actinokineospora sp. UTMC 2448]
MRSHCKLAQRALFPATLDAVSLRDRKKRQTRSALVRAALELVHERGVDHVTVEDIARRADVAPRTFFNYFATKEDALVGPDPESGARIRAGIADAPAHLGAVEALRLALQAEITELASDHKLWTLHIAVLERHPELMAKAFAGGAEAERQIVAGIAERTGQAVTDTYPLLLAAAAGAAFRVALTRWSTLPEPPALGELLDESFHLLATGLPDPR